MKQCWVWGEEGHIKPEQGVRQDRIVCVGHQFCCGLFLQSGLGILQQMYVTLEIVPSAESSVATDVCNGKRALAFLNNYRTLQPQMFLCTARTKQTTIYCGRVLPRTWLYTSACQPKPFWGGVSVARQRLSCNGTSVKLLHCTFANRVLNICSSVQQALFTQVVQRNTCCGRVWA